MHCQLHVLCPLLVLFPGDPEYDIVGTYLIFCARHSTVMCAPTMCLRCVGIEDPAYKEQRSFNYSSFAPCSEVAGLNRKEHVNK